ncbi:MAG: class I SAM-dependent methyltransferase [Kiritimatiellae bacterium]|nr:class I SAM-dependent methyltransferase [Kiritimatiellia bacterium]MDD4341293.1 class I SAM-dependent methyltransferase [Kiritimatiellia bacterium]MDY0149102.1 class I SAM-dependent methyltransferase [Kiritimatiellia bacterium]
MARQDQCPLCGTAGPFERVQDIRKRWHRCCGHCHLLFVEDAFLPSPSAERQRYATHQNGPHDAGYVAFLRQAIVPARPYLQDGMRGLDYGCGHTPTLCGLLEETGVTCENYDPYFYPDPPRGPYDVVWATEVVEHFYVPAREWERMTRLVKPDGLLVVMTAPWETLAHFRSWGYASDETHVCFYRPETVAWIRATFGFVALESRNPRVFLMQKIDSNRVDKQRPLP